VLGEGGLGFVMLVELRLYLVGASPGFRSEGAMKRRVEQISIRSVARIQ